MTIDEWDYLDNMELATCIVCGWDFPRPVGTNWTHCQEHLHGYAGMF